VALRSLCVEQGGIRVNLCGAEWHWGHYVPSGIKVPVRGAGWHFFFNFVTACSITVM
jgi:hypothetical protein